MEDVYLQRGDCVFAASRVFVCVFIPQCRGFPDCSLGFWGARCVQVVDTGMKPGLCSFHWIRASTPSYRNQSSSGLNGQKWSKTETLHCSKYRAFSFI